ncbi:Bicyclomycin resistance protein [Corynebacterium endometrii]|uniref:Bicyclomycin resistance protein n=2 Tax=Corynebacterium endometrii TaxID=2488819 RepID=A0A4P7QI15_9CORY|nr:Bicyclomycin resistance protein [Corynebacterium endometrii]
MALALLTATAPFATDMHLPVLPAIAAEFGVTTSIAQLTLSGFFAGMGLGQLIIGPISDVVGRRKLLLAGAVLAALAAVIAALAPGVWVLIIARVIQGFGGGACVVLARAIIPDLVRGDSAAKAFSLLMAINGLAPAVAPVIGGLLAEPVGWRGIHWALAGLHVIQLLIAWAVVPETGSVKEVASVRAFAGAVAGNYVAVLKSPLIWGYLLAMAMSFGTMFCYVASSPFIIQEQMGFSASGYSLIFALISLGIFSSSLLNARLVGRLGSKTMLRIAVGSSFVSSWLLFAIVMLDLPDALKLVGMFLVAAPTAVIMANSTALATSLMRERSGSVSAEMGFAQALMGAVMSPLVGLAANPAVGMVTGMVVCSAVALAGMLYSTARHPA